jgi:two-component system, chemotaxis family, response regulator Rcp1
MKIFKIQTDPLRLRGSFKAAGLTSGFHSVTDGEDALAYVRREGKYANVPSPDLIFVDLSLPKVSGLEVLKAIKSTPSVNAHSDSGCIGHRQPRRDSVRAVYALNGNAFMRKPNDLVQFLRFVDMCYEFWGNVVTLSPKDESKAISTSI